jgi:FMN phosphatase YigB (HAD superfamily)
MNPDIEAIFLDVGNTLRIVLEDPEFQAKAKQDLMKLVGTTESEEVFFAGLEERWKAYRKASKKSLKESSEKDLWSIHLLPGYPAEKIAPLAGKLTRLWRDHDGIRVPRHDVKATVLELAKRGYKIGIIANTITETEIPDWIESDGLTDIFNPVILSSKVGLRKPDPEIYWLASREIGVKPVNCAYVGDNPIRDVEGTHAAGYGMMIVIDEPATLEKEPQNSDFVIDYHITEISQLLDIFPARK